MKKRTLGLMLMAGAALAAFGAAQPASAAGVVCSYDAGTHKATVTATGEGVPVLIVRNGTAIYVNGVACGAADVTNTAKILVNGGEGRQDTSIDFGGGAFEPGFGADTGTAEIEFQINLGLGTERLILEGRDGADNFRLGTGGINDNGDADVDISLAGVDEFSAHGNGGVDVISAAGGLGTGLTYPGAVSLVGEDGKDTLTGGDGRDSLYGDNEDDVVSGGDGNDYISAGAGADTLSGGDDNDTLYPGIGPDVVDGGNGNDNVYPIDAPPDGKDVVSGGAGTDSISYYPRTSPLSLSLDGVANDGLSGENDNIKPDIENVTGGQGADTITGSDANNQLEGYLGPDTIYGGGGNDYLYGGYGDPSADILHGGDGNDNLYGYDGNDKLYGEGGADSLSGGLNNDLLVAGRGDDYVYADYDGADGSDDVNGGVGVDTAYYYRPTGNQTISIGDDAANDGLAGENDNIHSDVENITAGEGNDTLSGNASANTIAGYGGNDIVDGRAGPDSLVGDNGDDTITGGDGSDSMYGYEGADKFKAQDGGYDYVEGGNGTDTVVNKDSFDLIIGVP
jgi:Ca2+-binding RTX toxin-like protein